MLKEILASTTNLQKRMVAQEDRLGTLSGEVASLKVDQEWLHVAVNKVQSSQLNNAAKNDGSVGATEDEPRNEGSSQAGGMASALLNAASHKLRFPKYDGTEDPLPESLRSVLPGDPNPRQREGTASCILHAGGRPAVVLYVGTQPGYPNLGTFHGVGEPALRTPVAQQPPGRAVPSPPGSVANYMKAFLTHLSRCDTITEPHQVAIFTAGLGEPLQTDVELQRPASLEDAMGLARAYERHSTTVMLETELSLSTRERMTLGVGAIF
jgi:hypothetical protein